MGSALARLFGSAGLAVLLAGRGRRAAAELARVVPGATAGTTEWVASRADIVILAVSSGTARLEVAPRIRPLVVGKPVVDVSNPPYQAPWGAPEPEVSRAELIAAALPGACVVKALNCVAAAGLADLGRAGGTVTVPIAGDHTPAKRMVAAVLERAGLDPVDAGPLRNSRWVELLTRFLMSLDQDAGRGRVVGLRVVRLDAGGGPARGNPEEGGPVPRP